MAARARLGTRPVARGGIVAVLLDREHLSEPFAFTWLDEGPGRERAGALEPVLDMEDAIRSPLEVLLDYGAFVRLLFADYDVAFLNADVEGAATAWDARRQWRRQVYSSVVDVDWTIPRGQEWRDAFECPAQPTEPVRSLNQIRRTSGSERRHGQESISFAWAAPPPIEGRPSVPIDDLFDYDRFCLRYVQMAKRLFCYEPAESADSEFASTAAWRRYVHELLVGS